MATTQPSLKQSFNIENPEQEKMISEDLILTKAQSNEPTQPMYSPLVQFIKKWFPLISFMSGCCFGTANLCTEYLLMYHSGLRLQFNMGFASIIFFAVYHSYSMHECYKVHGVVKRK